MYLVSHEKLMNLQTVSYFSYIEINGIHLPVTVMGYRSAVFMTLNSLRSTLQW